MAVTYQSEFAVGDRVFADGNPSIVGVVTALAFRADGYCLITMDYIHNGEFKSIALEHWRLSLVQV